MPALLVSKLDATGLRVGYVDGRAGCRKPHALRYTARVDHEPFVITVAKGERMRVRHASRPPDIAGLLGVLSRHGVRYVLAGSVAALAYGADIGPVGDLDIVPALDEQNLSRLAAALREIEAGLDLNAPFGHWETRPDDERKWVVDAPTPEFQAQRAHWRPEPADVSTFDSLFYSCLGNLDVVPEISGAYDTLMKRAAPMRAWGVDLWVIHIDELLAALTTPRRPNDAPRVRQLHAIQRQRAEGTVSREGNEHGATSGRCLSADFEPRAGAQWVSQHGTG